MKSLVNRRLIIVVFSIGCLMNVLLMAAPTRSGTLDAGQYDPWADVSGPTQGVPDGVINMRDIAYEISLFNTHGIPIERSAVMSSAYDTGWINLTGQTNQNYTLTHNLNLTGADMIVDARQKTPEWNKTYGGTRNDGAEALVQTGDGGYTLAGWTYSFGAGDSDAWLVKTDASGTAQWNKTYGGTGTDMANALVQTGDGGYALAGFTGSFGAGRDDFWLVKTDANGNAQWNRTYGGTNLDYVGALVQTDDGGYALAGSTNSFGAGGDDFWLVKTDAIGNVMWNKTYGGTDYDDANALVQTSDGGYALAGRTGIAGAGTDDLWLVKTDASGNMQWNKTYGGTDYDDAYALVQTTDGGYALAGITESFGAGNQDFWLVKTDTSGTVQWNKTYGGTSDDDAFALVQTSDGGYALAGWTYSFGAEGGDFWLVKTDAGGNMQWNKTNGGTDWEDAYALVQTSDGGYALAGNTASFGAGGVDLLLVKTGTESGLAWVDSSSNTITLYRGATDPYWNYVRVRLWKPR